MPLIVRKHLAVGFYALWLWGAIANTGTTEVFQKEVLARIDATMHAAIREHRLPGGVFWLEHLESSYHKAYGQRALEPSNEVMTEETLFDIASLTKVVATAPSIMILMETGQIDLQSPVHKYLPEFKGTNKEAVTLRQLLTHTSGLPSTFTGGMPDSYESALKAACREPLQALPDRVFRYSDVGFILLGEVVQRVTGKNLDAFALIHIFQPLKMNSTCFRPALASRRTAAPTQALNRGAERGIVHDQKARLMGGVAGHAGVFSTAADLARYARMILNEGELEGVRILRSETVRLMISSRTPAGMLERRGLGWDISSPYSRPRGDLFPPQSFGHTGFTGTSLWVDPISHSFWILLSNRVYPDGRGNILALQSKLGTLSAEAINDLSDLSPPSRASSVSADASPLRHPKRSHTLD